MLTFDKEAHRYFWDGVWIPNVTFLIAYLTDYSRIPPDVLANAIEEGNATHYMVELDCHDDLDVDALTGKLAGQYRAWAAFKEATGFVCWQSEMQIYHPVLRYAGTADLFGLMPKLAIKGPVNIDIKRSLYAGPAIGVQLAGYTLAWNHIHQHNRECKDRLIPGPNRFALQLNENGIYRLQQYPERDDFTQFLASLSQFRWKEKHYGYAA